jgi:hypothetical protein
MNKKLNKNQQGEKCPKCGGEIIRRGNYVSCKNNCGFEIIM